MGIEVDGANQKLILDSDGDTYLEAATDDTIKVYVSGAHDATISANAINILSGTTLTIDSGATITNSGTANGFSSADPSSADGDSLGTASLEWSDLYLADGGVIYFGNDQEITLTHSADSGLLLKHTATADDKPVNLVLQTGETDMAANDVIGKISFQAPDEGTGTDAVLISAAIQARAEGDHSSSSNATSLDFMTGASEAAAKQWSLLSTGHWLPAATDHGIYLGVNSVAASNLLDDYEEGTWTPSWSAGGGSLTGTSSNYGKYTKIGDTVHLWFGATIDSGTASSYYRITNAPFTSATNGSGTAANSETANLQKAWWDSGGTTVNINRYDGTVESDPNLKVHITMKV